MLDEKDEVIQVLRTQVYMAMSHYMTDLKLFCFKLELNCDSVYVLKFKKMIVHI